MHNPYFPLLRYFLQQIKAMKSRTLQFETLQIFFAGQIRNHMFYFLLWANFQILFTTEQWNLEAMLLSPIFSAIKSLILLTVKLSKLWLKYDTCGPTFASCMFRGEGGDTRVAALAQLGILEQAELIFFFNSIYYLLSQHVLFMRKRYSYLYKFIITSYTHINNWILSAIYLVILSAHCKTSWIIYKFIINYSYLLGFIK